MDSEPNGEEEEKNAQNVPSTATGTHDEYKHDEQQEQEEDVEITTGGIRTIPVPDVTHKKKENDDMCTPAAADVQRLPRADYPGRGHDTDQYNLVRQSNYRSYYGMQRR